MLYFVPFFDQVEVLVRSFIFFTTFGYLMCHCFDPLNCKNSRVISTDYIITHVVSG